MDKHFYYMACPLCQRDIDPSQPDYYRVLPLDSKKIAVFYQKPVSDEDDEISVGGLSIDPGLCYPALDFTQKAWCLHTRCLAFVDHLPLPKLHVLLDFVEPTFLPRSNPPHCRHGDFYYTQPLKERDPLEVAAAESAAKPTRKSFWERLFHCIVTRSKHDERLNTRSAIPAPSQQNPLISDLGFQVSGYHLIQSSTPAIFL